MNKLSEETSPYLLQHAHNPVHWYAWKEEAFERARKEDKPILVSIGYSTCHWCHVMERESFEDPAVADFMNEYFINIKVDREERPDVDQIYMEACQVINGNGGWPLNCFLTPDKRPFYAGTYYPPESKYGRPSWLQVLKNISNAFYNKRAVIEEQADRLLGAIENSGKAMIKIDFEGTERSEVFSPAFAEKMFGNIRNRFDSIHGGFGGAPKFPGSMALRLLLNYHYHTGNTEALDHVLSSLDKMIRGGIYDQLGGGFARYATDRAWLIPHFEKMLYDNALMINLLADAYKLTKKELYRTTIIATLDFIEREMTNDQGAFYSALDADSEGEEGKYYVWSKAEIDEILGSEAAVFCDFYDVSDQGNWEGKNILWRKKSLEEFAAENALDPVSLRETLNKNKARLLKARFSRVRPGLDDKVILSWNALMCSAYVNAYTALGIQRYKFAAEKNIDFIFNELLLGEGPDLRHTYRNGKAQYKAFLNDYAFLIKALLDVYSISFDELLLVRAQRYLMLVQQKFFDKTDGLYYFTSEEQKDLVLRRKELYDSALPSGNSTMADNLLRLGIILDNENYRNISGNMLISVNQHIGQYPVSFSRWAMVCLNNIFPVKEIAVVGQEAYETAMAINKLFIPGKILMSTEKKDSDFALLKGRCPEEGTLIYLCQNYSCQYPVSDLEAFQKLLERS